MADATVRGSTTPAGASIQLLGCAHGSDTTSRAPGRSPCSTAKTRGDHTDPWQYVGRPRTFQRYSVPSTVIRRDPFFAIATTVPPSAVRPWQPYGRAFSAFISFSDGTVLPSARWLDLEHAPGWKLAK
ncbi:hypothetical protein [Actinomadura geliboluensis]|uniref:hypothetical protein n=1 Tax=Actinomadura geliboluensis TaxID=882440 RepID=UPI002630B85A|nr:hypothetical protein [Actinomadura geliboluensis]